MGYDIRMVRTDGDEIVQPPAQRDGAPASPEAAARNRRIAEALRASNPGYDEHGTEGAGTLELTDERGLQVSLFEHEAALAFPFWDSLMPDAPRPWRRKPWYKRVLGR